MTHRKEKGGHSSPCGFQADGGIAEAAGLGHRGLGASSAAS